MPSEPSFTLFSLLPAELRLEIWRLSCHSRVVQVSYDAQSDRCTTTASVPAVLKVCHESRAETLRLYKKQFGTQSHASNIYFCWELDTLYIPRPSYMGYADSERSFTQLVKDTENVTSLALDHVHPSIRRPWEKWSKYSLMQSLPNLDRVSLVMDSAFPVETRRSGQFDLTDPVEEPSRLGQILEDTKAAYYFEVGGEPSQDGKEVDSTDALRLPPLVLKSKSWVSCGQHGTSLQLLSGPHGNLDI